MAGRVEFILPVLWLQVSKAEGRCDAKNNWVCLAFYCQNPGPWFGDGKKILLQYHCVQLGGAVGLIVQETVPRPWIKVKVYPGLRGLWKQAQCSWSESLGIRGLVWVCLLGWVGRTGESHLLRPAVLS